MRDLVPDVTDSNRKRKLLAGDVIRLDSALFGQCGSAEGGVPPGSGDVAAVGSGSGSGSGSGPTPVLSSLGTASVPSFATSVKLRSASTSGTVSSAVSADHCEHQKAMVRTTEELSVLRSRMGRSVSMAVPPTLQLSSTSAFPFQRPPFMRFEGSPFFESLRCDCIHRDIVSSLFHHSSPSFQWLCCCTFFQSEG